MVSTIAISFSAAIMLSTLAKARSMTRAILARSYGSVLPLRLIMSIGIGTLSIEMMLYNSIIVLHFTVSV